MRLCSAAPLLLLATACTTKPTPPAAPRVAAAAPRLVLSPCTIPGVDRPARCGTAHVLEDRARPGGRVVPLDVVVVPAAEQPAAPDPVVYLVGGPGGAATASAADIVAALPKASARHDFVFVDQRGMGKNSPLRCKLADGNDLGTLAGGALPEARLRECLATMDADPSLYTTAVAADDLDEVLGALGYAHANLLGESYGTFAAQTMAKAHPARVRSLVLNGVVSPREEFVVGFAASAEAVLEKLFAECAADATCHARFPDPKGDLAKATARLRAHPIQTSAVLNGTRYTATLDDAALVQAVRAALYAAESRGPALVMLREAAEGNDEATGPTALEFGYFTTHEVSVGAYLSIACAESLAGVTEADAERAVAGTFLGMARVGPVLAACSYWPKRPVPAWLHDPVTGDLPALFINGTMDPATPLEGMELAASKLAHAQRIVIEGGGHGDVVTPCIDGIIAAFLEDPTAKVDASCVKPLATNLDPKPD